MQMQQKSPISKQTDSKVLTFTIEEIKKDDQPNVSLINQVTKPLATQSDNKKQNQIIVSEDMESDLDEAGQSKLQKGASHVNDEDARDIATLSMSEYLNKKKLELYMMENE